MLRRLAAILSTVALLGMPAVAGTRLFCRYTGIEITGCEEQAVATHATVRDEGCCDHRTFEVMGSTLPSSSTGVAPPIFPVIAVLASSVLSASSELSREPQVPSGGGPPAFLSHRALLI